MKGNEIYEPPRYSCRRFSFVARDESFHRFMSVQTALEQLMEIDEDRGSPGIVGKDSLVVVVAEAFSSNDST